MPHSAHVPYIHNNPSPGTSLPFQAPSISAFTFHMQQIRSPQGPSNVKLKTKMLYSRNVHEKKVKHLFHYAKQKNVCFYNIIETTRQKKPSILILFEVSIRRSTIPCRIILLFSRFVKLIPQVPSILQALSNAMLPALS